MPSELINPALAKALSDRGYETLTPVQLAVLEPEAKGRDLLVSARTGSGKTVAYGLVLADTLIGPDGALSAPGAPQALVIAPTRELAMQVQRELQWLYAGARVVSCVGGMDPRAERRVLDQGCHVVVGTPGRLRDHLERGQLRLEHLGAVILDEADEMLDLGFKEELEEILDATPKDRRTLLFSATLPKPIITLAGAYQRDALRLVVGAGAAAHSDIEYRAVRVAPSEVELATVNVLRYFESGAAIVFCNTRDGVNKLYANLVERGFNVVALSGELTQNERTRALQALRDRRARVCVATDVAARGIDIPDLDLVIHADIPSNREILQHRSGRTGRAGRKGVCVVMVPHPKRRRFELLLRGARIEAAWQSPPTADEIRVKDMARLIEAIQPAAEADEDDLAVARELVAQRSAEDIAVAYLTLARAKMPAPEDVASSEPEPYNSYGSGHAPVDATPRPGFEDAVWFRLDLGRNKNAEARWILPMICRRGHLTKREIGAIRIFERETRFQIIGEAVERFEAALAKSDPEHGRIERWVEGDAPPPRERSRSQRERAPDTISADIPAAEGAPYSAREDRRSEPKKPWTSARERPEAGVAPERAPRLPHQDRPAKGPKKDWTQPATAEAAPAKVWEKKNKTTGKGWAVAKPKPAGKSWSAEKRSGGKDWGPHRPTGSAADRPWTPPIDGALDTTAPRPDKGPKPKRAFQRKKKPNG
jgi:ATP-dependent RNA helicase DeaD